MQYESISNSSIFSNAHIILQSNKSIFVRSIDKPEISKQYTAHTAQTTVARFSPSGFYIASGDVTGSVRVWDCVGEGATKGRARVKTPRLDLSELTTA